MSVQSSPDTQDLKTKLEKHAEKMAQLHRELLAHAAELSEKAERLRKVVKKHEAEYSEFNRDALDCVGPTGRK